MAESILDLLFNPNDKKRARRTGIYGPEGIGKSSLGAKWPSPVFLPTEDGLRDIEGVQSFPMISEIGDMRNGCRIGSGLSLAELIGGMASQQALPFKTLVVDTIDGLHKKVESNVQQRYSDADRGYGKDVGLMCDVWQTILNALEWLNINRNLEIVLLSHYQIEKFADPLGESYNYYSPRLQAKSSALIRDWCDEFLFFNYHTMVIQKDEGFNRQRGVAVESGNRSLFTVKKPGYVAKSRIRNLPEEIPVLKTSTYHDLIGQYLPQVVTAPSISVAG
jgi:hypothetical protein